MAEKKITADKKAEEAVKEVKAEVKSAAEKTGAAVKETAKKAVKTAEKAVKTAAKATKAKKETVKKAVEAEIKDEVFVQFAGVEINVEAVVAAAKADYKAKGHRTPKTVSVYIKPEEGVAYYTVKGVGIDNSAGIERFPEAQFDMVRLGIGLYGIGFEGLRRTLQL